MSLSNTLPFPLSYQACTLEIEIQIRLSKIRANFITEVHGVARVHLMLVVPCISYISKEGICIFLLKTLQQKFIGILQITSLTQNINVHVKYK